MRNVLIVFMALLLMSSGEVTDFGHAKEEAARDNKLILIRFTGSDWCKPCKVMDKRVFANDSFASFATRHLVMLEADFPQHKQLDKETKKQNKQLARKYQKSQSYPYTVLLDAEGNLLKTWRGYGGQYAGFYIDEISAYLLQEHTSTKDSASLTRPEL